MAAAVARLDSLAAKTPHGVTFRQGRVADPGEYAEVRRRFRVAHGARAAPDPGRLRHLSAAVADREFRNRHHGARTADVDLLLLSPQVRRASGAADAHRANAAHAARLRRRYGSGARARGAA